MWIVVNKMPGYTLLYGRSLHQEGSAVAGRTELRRGRTRTSAFGVSERRGHDSSAFYASGLYQDMPPLRLMWEERFDPHARHVPPSPLEAWADRIYCQSSTCMSQIPDGSVSLVFTSPPYNVGKEYDLNLTMREYLKLIGQVGAEVYRVLKPGGRYLLQIANVGRRPYLPLTALMWVLHMEIGFLPMGEIIWVKGEGASGSAAWGTWRSAKAPALRDLHEYILVMTKERFGRPDLGESTISREAFLQNTLSVWKVRPESARRVGHPAPFPVELAERVIETYSYRGDVVLDPFCGSGSTCVAAVRKDRRYVGYDINPEYCELARRRVREALSNPADGRF